MGGSTGYHAVTERMSVDHMMVDNPGVTSTGENKKHIRMQGADRPENNASAARSIKRLWRAPPTETRYVTAVFKSESQSTAESQVSLCKVDGYVTYSTLLPDCRSGSRIHLKSLNFDTNFYLRAPTLPQASATTDSTWNAQSVRMIVIHRPYVTPYTDKVAYANQLLLQADGSALTPPTAFEKPYNWYNNSSFRVLYDQWIPLCPTSTAEILATSSQQSTFLFKPYYNADYTLSLKHYIPLQGMMSEYPLTTAGQKSDAFTGGLHVLFISLRPDGDNTEKRLTIRCNLRLGFADK